MVGNLFYKKFSLLGGVLICMFFNGLSKPFGWLYFKPIRQSEEVPLDQRTRCDTDLLLDKCLEVLVNQVQTLLLDRVNHILEVLEVFLLKHIRNQSHCRRIFIPLSIGYEYLLSLLASHLFNVPLPFLSDRLQLSLVSGHRFE